MRVLAPSSVQELQRMLHDAVALADSGPVVIRYPKGTARSVADDEVGSGTAARRLRSGPADGSGPCILAIGKMVGPALAAADALARDGIEATVWDVRCCAPLDEGMLADASRHAAVVTVEDGIRDGGIGQSIASALRNGPRGASVPVDVLGIPTSFIPHAKPDAILARLGLDADGIARTTRSLLS